MKLSPVVAIFLVQVAQWGLGLGQYLDAVLSDEEYLNLTHTKVKHEVITKRQELIDQVEAVRVATREYIGAKIKENLFKALREMAEKELEMMSNMQNRPRQPRPRQDEDDDEESTTERGIIPQLATIVQAIFGNNDNLGKYVTQASKLLPRPIGNQLVGVASLIIPNQFTTTPPPRVSLLYPYTPSPKNLTTTTTPSTIPIPQYVQQSVYTSILNNETAATPIPSFVASLFNATVLSTTTEEDDDDNIRLEEGEEEEEEERRGALRAKRQFSFPGIHPMKLLDGIEAMWKNYRNGGTNATTTTPSSKLGNSTTTESDDGFDDDYTATPRIKAVLSQVDALRKGVPDLFQGAREAYKFLEHLNGFLDNWENRLLATDVDLDLDD